MRVKEYLPNAPLNFLRLYYSRIKYAKCRIHSCYISQNVEIGENSLINRNVSLSRGVKIGKYTYINNGSHLGNNTIIGNFCSISYDCKIGLADHPLQFLAITPHLTGRENVVNSKDYWKNYHDKVEIGHDVWVGANAVILQGVKVGNGAIIGAGAIVRKDVEPYSVVVGVPAKVVRKRFSSDEVQAIEGMEWWNWDIKKINDNKHLFALNDTWKDKLNHIH